MKQERKPATKRIAVNKPNNFSVQLKEYFTRENVLLTGVFFIVVAGAVTVFLILLKGGELDTKFSNINVAQYQRQLDGVNIRDSEKIDLRPVGFIIDNHADARPVHGLEKASIIFETIAEGQITRFLAIFDPLEIPESLGPIRSVRPYFIDWAEEFDAIVTHVGGSPEALQRIQSLDHIDEFLEGKKTFIRDDERYAPHNTFTDRERILNSVSDNSFRATTSASVISYGDGISSSATDVNDITINFSQPPYNVDWKLSASTGRYERYHDDISQGLLADNLLVLVMDAQVIDDQFRRRVITEGNGSLWYVRNGSMTIGSWEKIEGEKIKFFDVARDEILFHPGVTWISVLDDESKFDFYTK